MQGVNGAIVSGNDIGNFNGATDEDDKGIWLATGTINAVVNGNNIHNLAYTGTGGYGNHGIYISTGVTSANIIIKNNMIAALSGDGYAYTGSYVLDNTIGIVLSGTQTGISIFFNSINLTGNTLNQSNAMSMGIYLATGSVADIRNNIIVNNLGLLSSTGYGAAGIYAVTSNAQFSAIDYNDYYVNPTGSGVKALGQIASTARTDLTGWRTATGQDANSKNFAPDFTSTTDLHLNVSAVYINYIGTPISGITTDYDGDTRDASYPYIGADEATSYPLPVELTSFTATTNRLNAELRWATATETNNYGFEIERRKIGNVGLKMGDKNFASTNDESVITTSQWSNVSFISGSGTSSSSKNYSFTDRNLSPGRYTYRIKQVDNDGTFKYYGNAEIEVGLAPKVLTLAQNYPNPFNPTTTITFTVPEDGWTSLKIFNTLGQLVTTVFEGDVKSGYIQKAVFDASRLSSGVYFSRIEFNGKQLMKKLILMK
jgi:hypothetical protein